MIQEDFESRLKHAENLIRNEGNFDLAISELEQILEKDQDNPGALILLGEMSELMGAYPTALHYYLQAADNAADNADIHYRIGLIYLHYLPERKNKAEKHFKKALKRKPDHIDAMYRYALVLAGDDRKVAKAVRLLNRVLKLNNRHPFANYDLALIYLKMSDLEAARYRYFEACVLNPELKTPENDLAFEILETEDGEHVPFADVSRPAPEPIKQGITKTVLITGATSGIGKACAEIFATNGYRLILTGRRVSRLLDLKNKLQSEHQTESHCLVFDVRNLEEVEVAIASLPEQWRAVDILINNAGLAKGLSPIHAGNFEHWETMIDTNIKGLLYMTRLIAPAMVARKQGHIINIGSTAGKEIYPNGNVYCATKFAVDALTKAMRLDLFQHNIRVSQVAPGHVEETEFALVRFDGDEGKASIYKDFKPLKAEDVASIIYFIVTQPSHVNIQDVLVMCTQQAGSNFIDRSGR